MSNPNSHTVVTHKGYFKRLMESFGKVVLGIVLFIGSFAVLYMNEGRVDMSEVAVNAVEASAETVSAELDDQFVYVTGTVSTDEQVGDYLFLNEGDYLAVQRTVEMYAWVETSSEETETNLGGSETTTTTYYYNEEWVENVEDSNDFDDSSYYNPSKTYESEGFTVSSAKIGAYDVNFDGLELPKFKKLSLDEEMLDLSEVGKLQQNYVYIPYVEDYMGTAQGSLSSPDIGDIRISYTVLDNNSDGTIFGKINGSNLETYYDADTEKSLYRFFDGGRDQALAILHGEFKMMLWMMRLLGFVMMWVGLASIFGPISVLLDVVPVFGALSRSVVGFITFLVALVLSIITIIISMIMHSIVALIITVLVVCGIVLYIMKKKGTKPTVVKV